MEVLEDKFLEKKKTAGTDSFVLDFDQNVRHNF